MIEKNPPLKHNIMIPEGAHPGSFGSVRKHDIHTGIDLYCNEGDPVFAIEDGEVIDILEFTGFGESPWWNDTYAVVIKNSHSKSFWLYGEIDGIKVKKGQKIASGDLLAYVKTVLKKDKNKPMTMLHMELYSDYKSAAIWYLNKECPIGLENPTEILKKIYQQS